jgi:hypothetical protein
LGAYLGDLGFNGAFLGHNINTGKSSNKLDFVEIQNFCSVTEIDKLQRERNYF